MPSLGGGPEHSQGNLPGLLVQPAKQKSEPLTSGGNQPRHHAIPVHDARPCAACEGDPFLGRGQYQPYQGPVPAVLVLEDVLRQSSQEFPRQVWVEGLQPRCCEDRCVGHLVAVVTASAERLRQRGGQRGASGSYLSVRTGGQDGTEYQGAFDQLTELAGSLADGAAPVGAQHGSQPDWPVKITASPGRVPPLGVPQFLQVFHPPGDPLRAR